jgi:DNA-binding MarR family transcriptional regulator
VSAMRAAALENSPAAAADPASPLDELRLALFELLGAERRLRARQPQRSEGLTNAQVRALAVLHRAEEVTAGELAKSADLNPASVTAMLDHLESRGIIERKRGTADRRVCIVSLSPAGRALFEEHRARWLALWDEALGSFSDHELTVALRAVRKMIQVFEQL